MAGQLERGLKLVTNDPAEPGYLEEVQVWLYHAEQRATTVVRQKHFANPVVTSPLYIHPDLDGNGQLSLPKVFLCTGLQSNFDMSGSTHADRFNDLVTYNYNCYGKLKVGSRDYWDGPMWLIPGGGHGVRLFSDGTAADRVAASNGFAPCFSLEDVPITIVGNQNMYFESINEGTVTLTTARYNWITLRGILGREL